MPKIYCRPDNIVIEASNNETILEAALRQGISLSHICGGNGRCSTCRVLVQGDHESVSKPTPEEKEVATFVAALFAKGITHDLFLEAGVLLVSIKVILMQSHVSSAVESMEEKLDKIQFVLERVQNR